MSAIKHQTIVSRIQCYTEMSSAVSLKSASSRPDVVKVEDHSRFEVLSTRTCIHQILIGVVV